MLYAVVRRIAGDDDLAQDYAQEAWIRAIRALPTFRGDARFSTWLHRIAVNSALQAVRRAESRHKREAPMPESPAVAQPSRDALLSQRLEWALDLLPERMRKVLILHDVEGYTHDEIGELLGTAAGTSKSQLFKARGFSLATGPGGRMTWVMTGDSLERWSLPPTDFVVSSVRPTGRYTSVRSTDSALPLEYLLLTSVAADSVKSAIVQLREQLNDVHEATRRRELEIVQVVPRRTRGTDLSDRELDRLKSDDARVTEELSGLAMRLAEIGSVERESRMRAAGGDARATVQWSRPVTAHLVGRNFVGGAQFSEMNPELATYFGTDRGVLVIQVLSGTPASEAGLMPGDVVTGVGGSDIEDLRSFRDRLNQVYSLQRGVVLSLIRRRAQIFVTLSR